MAEELQIPRHAANLLFACGDGDAALLYLFQAAGSGSMSCPLPRERQEKALQVLQRLGLAERQEKPLHRNEQPVYSEESVRSNLRSPEFQALVGEAQRQLGRLLSTEELKSLLSIHDYLRLPMEVISLLLSYCIQRARERTGRLPGMRTIEKEACRWSDLGIDHVEAAVQYMQAMLVKQSRRGGIQRLLQIEGRRLTAAEEQYVDQWVDWNFPDDAIRLAYERTCLNTGGLKWPYMNSILRSWQEKGLHTVKEIREGDRAKAPAQKKPPVSNMMKDALKKMMEDK